MPRNSTKRQKGIVQVRQSRGPPAVARETAKTQRARFITSLPFDVLYAFPLFRSLFLLFLVHSRRLRTRFRPLRSGVSSPSMASLKPDETRTASVHELAKFHEYVTSFSRKSHWSELA